MFLNCLSCSSSSSCGVAMAKPPDQFTKEETEQRAAAALRAAFRLPPKPQSEMKLGKPRAKPKKSPNKTNRRVK
jgi:hypothetical protein